MFFGNVGKSILKEDDEKSFSKHWNAKLKLCGENRFEIKQSKVTFLNFSSPFSFIIGPSSKTKIVGFFIENFSVEIPKKEDIKHEERSKMHDYEKSNSLGGSSKVPLKQKSISSVNKTKIEEAKQRSIKTTKINDISCEKSPIHITFTQPTISKDPIKNLIADTTTIDTSQKGKILAKVVTSDELVEKLKKEIENSFEDFYENRIVYDKLIVNVQNELKKIKHLLISNKTFKEKIFTKISKDDKVKYNLLNEILRKLTSEHSKPDLKKINNEMLSKVNELSKPKKLDKFNNEMSKHSKVIIPSPNINRKLVNDKTTLSPVGRNLDRQFSEQYNNISTVNKSFSTPKYVPLNDRLPIVPSINNITLK